MVQNFADRPALRSLAGVGALLATSAAVIIGAMLAVLAAATVAVLAVMTSVVLGLAGLALRARRVRARVPATDSDIIEARRLGGHHWVAYGWNERR